MLLLFLSFLLLATAFQVTAAKLECDKAGAIKISSVEAGDVDDVYARLAGKNVAVEGEWQRGTSGIYTFHSEEATFISKNTTTYTILIKNQKYSVTCPAFVFSCRMVNISIDSCYIRDGVFNGKYTAYNFKLDPKTFFRFSSPYDLRYDVVTSERRTLTYAPNIRTPGFKDINITLKKLSYGNKYTLKWGTGLNITDFIVSYDACTKGRVYERAACSGVPGCKVDSDCYSDEKCEQNVCEALECGECGYAANHACLSYQCCSDEDCEGSAYCSDNKCAQLKCEEDEKAVSHSCAKISCRDDQQLVNETCVELECAADESAVNHNCQKLSCGFLKKAFKHKCINIFSYWFKRKA